DHRSRMDRVAVRLVVERDVARDDRNGERAAGGRHALDRLRKLPADLRLLRVAEVEAVREADRLARRARDVARSLEDGGLAAREGVEPRDPTLTVEGECEAADHRAEPKHGRVQPRASHSPRPDELVVAPVDEGTASEIRRRQQLEERVRGRWSRDDLADGCGRARLAQEVVARALVGEEARRYSSDPFEVPKGAKLAGR